LLGVGGMDLYRAEAPGPVSDKISARVSETAKVLWVIYFSFTVIATLTYWLLGIGIFDAVNHSFTSLATGGFSTKNASIAGFNNPALEWASSLFMFVAGVSFLLHFRLILKKDLSIFTDRELRFYFFLVLSATFLLAFSTWGRNYDSFLEAFRYSVFQVASIASTTGYATADYMQWGAFAQLVILILMVTGGCAGSTAGGIKCIRAMMLLKQGYRELFKVIHPKAVVPLKKDGRNVPEHISSAIFGYFFLYMVLLIVTSIFITASGTDLVTAVSATLSSLSNVGPGLGEVGPVLNYGGLTDLSKWLLGACMIIGRLEIFTLLVLFIPAFWRN